VPLAEKVAIPSIIAKLESVLGDAVLDAAGVSYAVKPNSIILVPVPEGFNNEKYNADVAGPFIENLEPVVAAGEV
jgi:hypothetical protein